MGDCAQIRNHRCAFSGTSLRDSNDRGFDAWNFDMRQTTTPQELHDRLERALSLQHYGRASQIADQITQRMLNEPYPRGVLARHLRALRSEGRYDDIIRIAHAYAGGC